MVVECKRPDVELTTEVLDQAIRYNMVLNVKYIAITNGRKTVMLCNTGERFELLAGVPKYNEMLCQQ